MHKKLKSVRLTFIVAFLFVRGVIMIMTYGIQSVTDNLLKLANPVLLLCKKNTCVERSKQQSVSYYTKVKTESYLHIGVRFSDTSQPAQMENLSHPLLSV